MPKTCSLLGLSGAQTARAITNRRVYRITCCGRLLCQKDVSSILPPDDETIGLSEIKLQCPKCDRELVLELFTGTCNADTAWRMMSDETTR